MTRSSTSIAATRPPSAGTRRTRATKQLASGDDDELERVVCRCVAQLADTLEPEYAAALKRVEVDGYR